MFLLTPSERLAIMAGASGIMCTVTLLVLLALCCLLRPRRSQDGEGYPTKQPLPPDPPPPYSVIPELINEMDAQKGHPENGKVILSVCFRRDEDLTQGQLSITLQEACNLPLRLYGSKCDPYFVIQVLRGGSKRKHWKPLCQFETPVFRKCQNPVYNESFTVSLPDGDLRKCQLKVTAWDRDRLTNDTALGETTLALKDMAASLKQNEEHTVQLLLKEPKTNNGELLLGLCYLPTAERMTVAVLKANNLKLMEASVQHIAPYVQAMAMYEGKVFEKRKTSSRPCSAFPVFNEMLMFDVPFSKLDHVVLLVTVRNSVSTKFNDDLKTQDKSQSKDPCMGKVVIGSSCKKIALSHWNAMKNSPRRQVLQWHVLR